MTVDMRLVVAEMRAGALLALLAAAVAGAPHWRSMATVLLDEIENYVLPEPATEARREVDARKRAAEILNDVCND